MKIISKYKDYYDYLVSKYGIDDKRVLDRTKFHPTKELYHCSGVGKVYIYICDFKIEVLEIGTRRVCGHNLEKYGRLVSSNTGDYYQIEGDRGLVNVLKDPQLDLKLKPNTKHDCPILIATSGYWHGSSDRLEFEKFPILKDYDIPNILDPDTIWCMLVDWLSREKQIENKLTDKEKIITHGFDKVTSFRKM